MLDRAAAERGEAGAEDHAGIEQVAVGDHAVVQAGDGLVEQRQDQAVFQVVRRLVVLRHLRLHRLAVLPPVQALAVLLAALAGLHRRQRRRQCQAQERRQLRAHALRHVQADGVDQFDRAHWHAELHRGLVDDRTGNAFGVGGGGFQHVREQHAVDQEARRAGDRHRELVQRLAERGQAPDIGFVERVVLDDLHQRHQRHRIEVVQAGELRRTLDVLAQFGQRNRRGVGGQQRIGLQARLDGLVEIALGLGVLDDRLDHQVRLRHAVAGQVALQARGHGGALALVLHLLGEQFLRTRERAIDEALLTVLQGDVEALVGGPRRDVATHHAGADDVHVRDAVVFPAKALQAFGQEEDADQVARGRRARQFHHRPALGIQARLDALATGGLPHVDQRVRRRVMRLRRLARDLLGHLRRQQLARQPAVADPAGETLLERALWARADQRDRGVHQHRRLGNPVDQAHGLGRTRRQRAAGEHHVHRLRCAHQARQAGAATPAGEDAQLHFGQADAGGRIAAGHAVVAGQRDLGAASHAEAVDRGHGGAGQLGQLLEHGLAAADRIVDGALAVELLEFLQVRAGDEAAGLGRAQHHALGRIDGQAFQDVGQFDQHILRERIDAGALAVESQHDDAVGAQLRLPVTESQPIEVRGHAGTIRSRMDKAAIIPRLFHPRQIHISTRTSSRA